MATHGHGLAKFLSACVASEAAYFCKKEEAHSTLRSSQMLMCGCMYDRGMKKTKSKKH
jgi:hypothetical protein